MQAKLIARKNRDFVKLVDHFFGEVLVYGQMSKKHREFPCAPTNQLLLLTFCFGVVHLLQLMSQF